MPSMATLTTCVVGGEERAGHDFVFVSREEIDYSVASVVALTDEDSSDASLEARVKAVVDVARVHELAVVEARGEEEEEKEEEEEEEQEKQADDDTELARRRRSVEAALEAESGEPAAREAVASGFLFGDAATANEFEAFVRARGVKRDVNAEEEEEIVVLSATVRMDATPTAARGAGEDEDAPAVVRAASAKDSTERQARRDIERDSVVLDGAERLEGGLVGYDAVVRAIVSLEKKLTDRAETAEWRALDHSDLSGFAKLALRAVNRTESGLDAIQAALLSPRTGAPVLVAVPDSKKADPLRVSLYLKPMRRWATGQEAPQTEGPTWRWGLRALVEGATSYRLFAADDFERERARAKATYTNTLLLPLDGLQPDAALYDKAAAKVALDFIVPHVADDTIMIHTTDPAS